MKKIQTQTSLNGQFLFKKQQKYQNHKNNQYINKNAQAIYQFGHHNYNSKDLGCGSSINSKMIEKSYNSTANSQTHQRVKSMQNVDITFILEEQMKRVQKSMNRKYSKLTKTLKRRTQIQNQQQLQRSRLKTKIQQKMRKSQMNILQYKQKSTSSLSNKLKKQNKKIQEIKKLEKTIYNKCYQKSKQMRTATQKFFNELENRKKSISKSQSKDQKTQSSMIRNTIKQSNNISLIPLNNIHKIIYPVKAMKGDLSKQLINQTQMKKTQILSFLRTPRQNILEKQKKKIQKQQSRQKSLLRQHIQKMQIIEQTRKKHKLETKTPVPTIAKLINRNFNEEQYYSKRKAHKSFIQQSISNKQSFSDTYQRRLQDKQKKKTFFLNQSIANGDNIIQDQYMQSNKLKLNKIIKESQNQLIRKGNFRYMEKYLQN